MNELKVPSGGFYLDKNTFQIKTDDNKVKLELKDIATKEELQRIVEGAPEAFDTLKEVSDWINKNNKQADWNISDPADPAYIKNKPSPEVFYIKLRPIQSEVDAEYNGNYTTDKSLDEIGEAVQTNKLIIAVIDLFRSIYYAPVTMIGDGMLFSTCYNGFQYCETQFLYGYINMFENNRATVFVTPGLTQLSPDGTKWKITVDNTGALKTEKVVE